MRIRKLNCCRRWIHPDVQQIQTTTMKMVPAKKKVKSMDGIFQKLIKNKECEEKKLLQEILANEVIASGDVFNCNKMDFKLNSLGKREIRSYIVVF